MRADGLGVSCVKVASGSHVTVWDLPTFTESFRPGGVLLGVAKRVNIEVKFSRTTTRHLESLTRQPFWLKAILA